MRFGKEFYRLVIGALLLGALGCDGGTGSSGKAKAGDKSKGVSSSGKPVASMQAGVLWEKFKENELQADPAYKDKVVEVSGRVTVIEKSKGGQYYVGILTVTPNMVYDNPLGRYDRMVVGYIKELQRNKFAELKRDQPITIAGKVIGVTPNPTVYGGQTVELGDCWFVKKGFAVGP